MVLRLQILTAVVCALPLVAVAQSADALFERASDDFDAGRFAEAREALEKAVSLTPDHAQAYHLLARICLEIEPRDPDRARWANDRALKLEPENVEYLSLRLSRLRAFRSPLLPAFQTARRQDLAEDILALDPQNDLAHLVLGEIAFRDYLDARASVSFPDLERLDVPVPREDFYNAAYLLNPVLVPDADAAAVEFRTSKRYAAADVPYVTRDGEAAGRYERVVRHLRASIEGDPLRKAAYRTLLTATLLENDPGAARSVVDRMAASLPDDYDAWLWRGLVSYRLNRTADAEEYFERALKMMDDGRANAFREVSRFLPGRADESGPAAGSDSFWAGKDPFLLSPANERWLEHMARMVYADLRFGDRAGDERGWDTEPGDVIVRYGVPQGEAQMTTRFDRYVILHYGDFLFKFMDLAKAGGLIFYSPKTGTGLPIMDEVERAFEEDYVLFARRQFRDLPQRLIYDRHGTRRPIPYLASALRGAGGGVDVYVAVGVPVDGKEEQVRTGAWLLDESGTVAAAADAEPGVGVRTKKDGTDYRVFVRRLSTRPGHYTLAVEYENSDRDEVGFHRQRLRAHEARPRVPGISDLVLAYSVEEGGEGGSMNRGGFSVEPAPWAAFGTGQPIYVFFEAYNLSGRTGAPRPYRIEAVLAPYDGGDAPEKAARRQFEADRRAGVSVSYSATARSQVEPQYLILDTRGTQSGTYIVGLRLTDDRSGVEAFAGRALVLE